MLWNFRTVRGRTPRMPRRSPPAHTRSSSTPWAATIHLAGRSYCLPRTKCSAPASGNAAGQDTRAIRWPPQLPARALARTGPSRESRARGYAPPRSPSPVHRTAAAPGRGGFRLRAPVRGRHVRRQAVSRGPWCRRPGMAARHCAPERLAPPRRVCRRIGDGGPIRRVSRHWHDEQSVHERVARPREVRPGRGSRGSDSSGQAKPRRRVWGSQSRRGRVGWPDSPRC
jgi:hypothetical protein